MQALSRAILTPPRVDGVPEASPMSGLERRSIGFVDVLAQSVGAIAPTAAAATLPALIAGQAGGSLLVCVALAWLLVGGVSYAVGQFTRRLTAPGSLYTFTTKGLGPAAGFTAAIALVVGYAFVAMFGLVGAALSAQILLRDATGEWANGGWVVPTGVVGFAAVTLVVLRRGIRISARVTLVVEVVAIAFVLALLVVVLASTDGDALSAPLHAGLPGPGHLVAGTAVAMTAFVGFESAASLGREARRPFLTVPRTMRWTLIAVGLLYLGSAYTQQAGVTALDLRLADNDIVMSSLAAHSDVPWMGRLVDVGQTTSFVACAIASLTALSRVVLTLGREGVLPPAVGRTDPLRGTPRGALLVVVPLTAAVPLVLLAIGWGTWHAMSALIAVSAVGYLTSYVAVCLAAPAFLRRIGELTWPVAAVGWGVGAVLAVGVVVYLGVVASEQPAAVWMVLGIVVAGVVGYADVRRRGALDRMGLFDEPTLDDLLGAG